MLPVTLAGLMVREADCDACVVVGVAETATDINHHCTQAGKRPTYIDCTAVPDDSCATPSPFAPPCVAWPGRPDRHRCLRAGPDGDAGWHSRSAD